MSAPLGVYIHWPFCKSKCPYCDFNSHVREGVEQVRWRQALLTELEHAARETPARRVETMFFGGGTPSLMEPATVGALIKRTKELWDTAPDIEITLEANPTSVEAGRFTALAEAGVNRVSLGVQALDPAALKFLGREHSVAEALDALAVAKKNFARHSFDLIYARPGQTPDAWADELERALALAGEHLSLYQLTIEADTPFAALHAAGKLTIPDDEVARALYDTTQEVCAAHGLPAYEISNHARPGAECRHNLIYWRYGEYAGIGPGAHGRLDISGVRRATATERHPERWLMRVESTGDGLTIDDALSRDEQADELLLMGLRLAEGIEPQRYASLAGRSLDAERVATLQGHGLIDIDASGRLRVTAAGFPVLDAVVADLAA